MNGVEIVGLALACGLLALACGLSSLARALRRDDAEPQRDATEHTPVRATSLHGRFELLRVRYYDSSPLGRAMS